MDTAQRQRDRDALVKKIAKIQGTKMCWRLRLAAIIAADTNRGRWLV